MTQPGWYPDPENPTAQRYWDGTAWAAPTAPVGAWMPAPRREPVEAVRTCLTEKYADFTGRASRSELWWFWLAVIVAQFAVSFVGGFMPSVVSLLFSLVSLVVSLGTIVPLLAASARRLHDLGQSAWLLLLLLVPCANIGLIIYLAMPGQPGPNAYDAA